MCGCCEPNLLITASIYLLASMECVNPKQLEVIFWSPRVLWAAAVIRSQFDVIDTKLFMNLPAFEMDWKWRTVNGAKLDKLNYSTWNEIDRMMAETILI